MKVRRFFHWVGIATLFACGDASSNQAASTSTRQTPATSTTDTSYYFVKRLLNASPTEVEAVLGKPDAKLKSTNDCVYLPRCQEAEYQGGKYEFEYSHGRVKEVTIQINGAKPYSDLFLNSLNFAAAPAFSNSFTMRWTGIEGIDEISIFPAADGGGIGYALIGVNADFNERFPIAGREAIAAGNVKAQADAADRKRQIESQFSAWDGSNRAVERAIKETMNDPGSYEHVSTRYWDQTDRLRVVTEFRGTNAFGAKVKNTAYAEVTLDGRIIKLTIE